MEASLGRSTELYPTPHARLVCSGGRIAPPQRASPSYFRFGGVSAAGSGLKTSSGLEMDRVTGPPVATHLPP